MDRHGRSWRFIEAQYLEPGDVVKDRGLVSTVWPYADSWVDLKTGDTKEVKEVHVVFVNGELDNYDTDELVFAFVRKVEVDG